MARWYVDFLIEPAPRDIEMEIEADSGKEAIVKALAQLEMASDELLHTIRAHISRPVLVGTTGQ